MFIVLSLLSLISTTITFNPTDTEYTAPGVVVEDIACIDLLAYGEPLNITWNSDKINIGCQAFFIERDGTVKWRVTILYRDKLVMLEQDREPLEYFLGYDDCRYAVFSPNGRFVFVGAETGTDEFPEIVYKLVDIEEETDILFPRTFDIPFEAVFWVANDGKVAMLPHARRRERADFLQRRAGQYHFWMPYEIEIAPDTLYFYGSDFNYRGQFSTAVGSPRVRCSDDGNIFILLYEDEILRLDSRGRVRWKWDKPTINSPLRFYQISANGSLFICKYGEGVWGYAPYTGECLFEASTDDFEFRSITIAENGNHWAGLFENQSLVENDESSEYSINLIRNNTEFFENELCLVYDDERLSPFLNYIFSNQSVCFKSSSSSEHYVLLNSSGDLLWQSSFIQQPRNGYSLNIAFGGNTNAGHFLGSIIPNAMFLSQNNQYYVAFISNEGLVIKRIDCSSF